MRHGLTRRSAGLSLVSAVTLASVASADANARSMASSALGRQMNHYMRGMGQFGFGGQVLAAQHGAIILNGAYGWADRSRRHDMTDQTPVGVGSTSKQFTAAALLKLADQGRVDLSAPISRYLPAVPADKAALTLDRILSHTAGLPPGDVADDFQATSKQDMLARVFAAPLVAPPGERWRYSNAGYNIAAAIIESVSGQSYEDYLTGALFHPVGMRQTGFANHASLRGAHASHAYRGWIDNGAPDVWPRENYRSWGAGSVFSTAEDIYKWQQALEAGRVVSVASVATLIAPHAFLDPDDHSVSYGYGAIMSSSENGLLIERSGDWEGGYNCAWHRWPANDMTLIVVSNSTTPTKVSMRQAVQADLEQMMRGATVNGQPPDAVIPSCARARALVGAYSGAEGSGIEVIDDGAYVWAAPRGQPAIELILGDGLDPARRDSYRAATAKTQALLSAPSRDAFATALAADGASHVDEYWNDWQGFVRDNGPFVGADVLGSTRAGRAARTLARLNFAQRSLLMEFLWSDFGLGRLSDDGITNMAPSVAARVIAESTGAGWISYDPMTGGQTPLLAGADALRFRSASGEIVLPRS